MEPPQDFITWHFAIALPQFIKRKKESFAQTLLFFNIPFLLKNLFSPYRRLIVTGDNEALQVNSFLDRLSFNLISHFMGAFIRFFLIIVGVFAITLALLLDLIVILLYLIIPVLTFTQYSDYLKNNIFDNDFATSQKLAAKLAKTKLFKKLQNFFTAEFLALFTNPTGLLPTNIVKSNNPSQVLISLVSNWPTLTSYLSKSNIKMTHFESLVNFLDDGIKNLNQVKPKPIGQILSFGYTRNLNKYSSKLTPQNLTLSKSQKETVAAVEKVLTRPQNNNILLVGEPGVGRHTIVEHLASQIASSNLPNLTAFAIVVLDAIALAGTAKNMVAVKSNFEAVLTEAKFAGNIILVIDQIDRLVTSQDERIDLSEVITTILKDSSLPIIGITTVDDFNQYIRPNALFLKLFTKIDVGQPENNEVLQILINKSLENQKAEGIDATLSSLLEIVDKTNQYVLDKKQPEKSLILLEDCIAEAKVRRLSQIGVQLVDDVLRIQTKIPLGEISKSEGEKLKKLADLLHKRIIGQNEAIDQLAQAIRRARTDIGSSPRPIGSLLFLGPTGVGKTETAKALAAVYFGKDDKMVRLDASEYQGPEALERLIGNNQTKTPGILADLIRENPYGLLLVDEFEKANRAVHNLFLQILDEGFMTDAFGKKVSFDNIIIIATSNAAAEYIREEVVRLGQDLTTEKGLTLKNKLINYVLEKGLFSPELINRFDAVIVYQPLTQEQIVQVSTILLNDLTTRLKETKNITLEITAELAQTVAQKGFDPTFGARPIRRLIQDKIEDEIAKMIIDGTVKNGDKVTASTLLGFL